MAVSLCFRSRPGPRSPRRPRPPHPSRLRRGQHRAPSTRLVLSWFASDALTPGDALASPVPCGWGLTLLLSGTQRAVLLCVRCTPPRTPPALPRLLTRGSQKSAALSLPLSAGHSSAPVSLGPFCRVIGPQDLPFDPWSLSDLPTPGQRPLQPLSQSSSAPTIHTHTPEPEFPLCPRVLFTRPSSLVTSDGTSH